ncbi:hypothetical protein NEMBOFW57_002550 [Staphylotrichum longicolle]|uniref:Arsenical-resistance protein n=1 Tax=Staphylotrichum longicolle TaxID=669026 RepID=A0AAD4I3R4_9PEZI|nr:hypothetical protein NEMBOFW57_002550 [Staphylotrichum longicolle]
MAPTTPPSTDVEIKVKNNSTTDVKTTNSDVEKQETSVPVCCESPQSRLSAFSSLDFLDRFLAVWIFLAMLIGILLGNFVDDVEPALQKGTFVDVSLPIAIGLLVMMYPILCKVQYEKLHQVFKTREIWIQLGFSIIINWIVAPLVMAGGNGDYCAILVAVNSLLQIILFAPISLLFIRVFNPHYAHGSSPSSVSISYPTVATSVGVFLGIPLGAAILTRLALLALLGPARYQSRFLRFAAPWSLVGLLFTILVLFASQGKQVVRQIVSVVRVAAPLVVYFAVIFLATLVVARRMGFRYGFAVTQSFTAASNNFELAIAVAVAAYGPRSDQALAATVGPLIEVPVLLGLVYGVKWYAKRTGWKE